MRFGTLIKFLVLCLPVNVFAHAGHVEWPLSKLSGMSEWIEATLVLTPVAIYLLVGRGKALKSAAIKTKRRK